ncbi:MAG TPA: outer membrane beta-barrel protein, partial [Salinimicrobium sp.]|nr:outer membrane beta-barrel protein [Salinimicrobium sp.]
RFSSKVTLPAKIQWQTTAYYRGASAEAQSTREPMASINMALSKELFNENASITLNIQDILNSRKYEAYTSTPAFNRESVNQWRRGGISLSFIYRFNQQKNQQQKRMEGNNDDEMGGEGFN